MGLYSDTTFNSGEYIPQYVGNTLQETKDTADTLTARHYKNIAEASALELALKQMQSKAIGSGKDYIAERVAVANQELEQMARTGAENSTAKIAALTNSLMGDQGVLASMDRAAEYNKFLEERRKTKDPVYDSSIEQQLLNSPVVDSETGELTSAYARPFDLRVEEGLNYMAKQDAVIDPLQPDTSETNLMRATLAKSGVPLAQFMQSNTYKQLTANKVNSYLFGDSKARLDNESLKTNTGQGWLSYKDSAEYRQQKLRGLSDAYIARELQGRGEAKMFTQTQKQFIGDPAFDRNGMFQTPPNEGIRPDVAQTIETPKLPFDIGNITESGDIQKSFVDQVITGFDQSLPTYQALQKAGQALEQTRKTNDPTKIATAKAEHKKASDAYYDEFSKRSEKRSTEAIPYFKAAAMYTEAAGANTDSMTQDEIKKWAGTKEGKSALKRYETEVLANRYEAPYVAVVTEEKDRTAKLNLIENTLSERYAVAFDKPNEVIYLGNNSDEAKEISQAFIKNKEKVRYPGDVQSKNWIANGTDKSARFAGASKIEIPVGDSGEIKTFYISKTANEIPREQQNLKVLYSIGRRIPGIPNKSKNGTQVYEPNSPAATIELKRKYAANAPWIMDWDSIVEVKYMENGVQKTKVAPNYDAAASQMNTIALDTDY